MENGSKWGLNVLTMVVFPHPDPNPITRTACSWFPVRSNSWGSPNVRRGIPTCVYIACACVYIYIYTHVYIEISMLYTYYHYYYYQLLLLIIILLLFLLLLWIIIIMNYYYIYYIYIYIYIYYICIHACMLCKCLILWDTHQQLGQVLSPQRFTGFVRVTQQAQLQCQSPSLYRVPSGKQTKLLEIAIYSGFTHKKWWFSSSLWDSLPSSLW